LPLERQTRIMHVMTEPNDRRHDMTSDTTGSDGADDATRQAEPDVLLQIEAADVAGVSVRTIQRAIGRGTLPAQRIDGKCWIRRDDLLAWNLARQAPGRHDARHVGERQDTSSHTTPETTRHASDTTGAADDARVARLERALADALAERDRWHDAWRQAETRRSEEADALRELLLLAQQTALARVQAIESGSSVQADARVAAYEGASEAMPAAMATMPSSPRRRPGTGSGAR
jgi:excisionase family DNA binding protein